MADNASGETGNTGAVPSFEGEAGRTVNRGPSRERVAELAGQQPLIQIDGLVAGYGKMEILHGVDLQVGAGQSLCLIGPNGAGKSTVLHSTLRIHQHHGRNHHGPGKRHHPAQPR